MAHVLEAIKRTAERLTGFGRLPSAELPSCIRDRKANTFRFSDDGLIPNHPRWPLIIYRGCLKVPDPYDPAAAFEDLFESNGWGDSWRDGIYDYVHYHSRIHEVLGIARGHGKVRFGGKRGRTFTLKAGDVAILPAGTGHQNLGVSKDFLVVGAYPPFGTYDECTGEEDRKKAIPAIARTGRPKKDPVYGSGGSLMEAWQSRRAHRQH
jgi:uncharacterized protein YjlB